MESSEAGRSCPMFAVILGMSRERSPMKQSCVLSSFSLSSSSFEPGTTLYSQNVLEYLYSLSRTDSFEFSSSVLSEVSNYLKWTNSTLCSTQALALHSLPKFEYSQTSKTASDTMFIVVVC